MQIQVLPENTEGQCQTSDVMRTSTSEDQSQSYDTSSDYQRSVGMGTASLRQKRMEISVGDEGGTTQAPNIGMSGAMTTKAKNRPSFMFNDGMDDSNN